MRTILLIALFIACGWSGFAQKIILSEKEDLNFRDDDFQVIGKYKTYTAVYKNHHGIGEVIFYNDQLVKEKVSTISFLPSSIEKIYFSNTANTLSVFYCIKESRKLNVYMSKLSDENSWSEPLLLDSSPSSSYRNNSDYIFCPSEDKSKTLVFHSFDENNMTILRMQVLDEVLNVVSKIEQTYPEQTIRILEEAVVTNEGTALIAASDPHNSKGAMESFFVLIAKKNTTSLSSIPISLEQNAISDLHLMMDNLHNNLYLSAYFSDGRYSSPRGIYMGIFDVANQTLSTSHFTPLTLQISKSRSDLRDLKIRNIFIKKSGDMEVVAEKTYQNTRSVGSVAPIISSSFLLNNMAENARIVHEFSYDEIALFDLKTDGSLEWNQTILKEQTTTDDNGIFSSYGVLQYRLGNVYLFSDMSSKQHRLLAGYVSSSGELTVKELQLNEEVDDFNLMPRSAFQISKSEIVMPCVSKNYLCFLKISY